jgi:hypothetical protein
MSRNDHSGNPAKIVDAMVLEEHRLLSASSFRPVGEEFLSAFAEVDKPPALADLTEASTRSYDLTVSAAAELQIPIAGSGSGGFNRRVIVLERAAFKKIEPKGAADSEKHIGYAIRLCVTVNKWEASAKVSLPFLAASAQLGTIEAQWILQVIGLVGKAIDAAILPPTELSVETFFIAKQSLEKLIAAINDPGTVLRPQLIAEIRPLDQTRMDLRRSIGKAYALTSLERGRSFEEARVRLGEMEDEVQDAIREVYEAFAGGVSPQAPSGEARKKAAEICGRIRADIPLFG